MRIEFADPASLRTALAGVEAVFLLGSGGRGQVEAETQVVGATKTAGVKKLVKLSIWRSGYEEYQLARIHRAIERAVEASDLQWTFLRPNGYMQNFANDLAVAIRS